MMSERRRRSREEAGAHRRNQRQQQDNGLSPLQIITDTGFAPTNWITRYDLRRNGSPSGSVLLFFFFSSFSSFFLFLVPLFKCAVCQRQKGRVEVAEGGSCRKEAAQQLSSRHPAGPADRLPPAPKAAGDTELFGRSSGWASAARVRTGRTEKPQREHTSGTSARLNERAPAKLHYENQHFDIFSLPSRDGCH